MESGTVETEQHRQRNGASGSAPERIEVHNPATGGLVGTIDVASAEDVAETVARVRGNQPAWEALGNEGRYLWLGKLRDWILDNLEEISDSIQAETGKVRGDISSELSLRRRADQLLRAQRREVHRRGICPAAVGPGRLEEAGHPVPTAPRGRRHQSLELPPLDGVG